MAEGASPGVSTRPLALLRRNPRMRRLTGAVLVSGFGDPLTLTVSLVLLFQSTKTPLAIAGAYLAQMAAVLLVGALVGGAADRVGRRRLIVRLELLRFAVVALLPLLAGLNVLLLYPAIFVLGGIEALVEPSRQASVPELVAAGEVGAANSLLLGALALAQAAGFAVAGTALAHLADPRPLYLVDACTFGVSALVVGSLGDLGGGIRTVRLQGGLERAWRLPGVRPLLVVAGATIVLVGALNPSILPVAYYLSANGPSAYSLLQMGLIVGIFVGSLAAGRIGGARRMAGLAAGLWLFALGVLGVGFSSELAPAVLAAGLSGVGNAVFSVTNNSALMQAADRANRGTVMAARFTVAQVAKAVGLGAGALATAWMGPQATFVAIGAGLVVVALGLGAYRPAWVASAYPARRRPET